MAGGEAALPAEGFVFCPSNETLVDLYLRAKIAGAPRPCHYLVDADVCSAPPYELAERHLPVTGAACSADGKVWYFFSPVRYVGGTRRMRGRTVDGKECWHPEGKEKKAGHGAGGYLKKFSYHVKTTPGVVAKPGWLMVEYRVTGCDTVLCKVYRSPRGPGRSCASSAAASCCKRKAADGSEHLVEAPPSSKARLQATDQGDDDDCMLFAGALEQELQSNDDRAAAPELGETQHAAEGQPEPQLAQAVVNGSSWQTELEKVENLMMSDDDEGMGTQVPDGEDPGSFFDQELLAMLLPRPDPQPAEEPEEEEVAAVNTVRGQLAEYDVIMALAGGETVGDLLGDSSATEECGGGGLPIPAMDPAYIDLALSAPDPDPFGIQELLMAP
ncbi:hypothetical protein ACP4OV_016838 [Aristida adscensionis]